MVKLSENIKALRTSHNLTQAALAAQLGKAGSTVRMWELGKASPDYESLLAMAHMFQVSTDALLGSIELPLGYEKDIVPANKTPEDKTIHKINQELLNLNPKQLKLVKALVTEISQSQDS